jgi:nitrogen-specific signal transduction histidine kinase/FixJ family two-component response regulator
MTRLRYLHLEDNPLDAELAASVLEAEGFTPDWVRVDGEPAFKNALETGSFDLIISDFGLPGWDGRSALRLARLARPEWPFIFLSGTIGEEAAIEGVRLGATDYVLKQRISRLAPVIRRALLEAEEHAHRRVAEEALQHAWEEQQALLGAARVVRVAPWSVRDGRLVIASSVVDLLGYNPAAKFKDLEALEIILHPDDRSLFTRMVGTHSAAVRTFECRMTHADGHPVWTRWTLRTQPDCEGVIQDITEHRQLQEQLVQSQKLESLGTLAAGVAHDFKNLLQAIGGHAELLAMRDPTPLQARGLETILQAVERGRALTAKLLTFSRDEPLQRMPLELDHLLQEVRTLLKPSLRGDIRLEVESPGRLPRIMADAHQLHQVLMNMVLNAQGAMPGPGSITLRCGRFVLSEERAFETFRAAGDYLFIEVEDTGKGIPADMVAKVFEPFFTTKAPGQGTGLGLSVAYGIVERHGGWIECRSQIGVGTCFRILLPLARFHEDTPSGPVRIYID